MTRPDAGRSPGTPSSGREVAVSGQGGYQPVDGREEEQVEIVEHGREGRRGEKGGQDGRSRRRLPSSFSLFVFSMDGFWTATGGLVYGVCQSRA